MTLIFFAYPIAAFMAHPHWGEVAHGALTLAVAVMLLTQFLAVFGVKLSGS